MVVHIHHFVSSTEECDDERLFSTSADSFMSLFHKMTHLFSFLSLAVDADDAAVCAEPVELPQHLHSLVAVLIRQIEQFGEQGQVLNCEGLCCKQRIPIGSRHVHILWIQNSKDTISNGVPAAFQSETNETNIYCTGLSWSSVCMGAMSLPQSS